MWIRRGIVVSTLVVLGVTGVLLWRTRYGVSAEQGVQDARSALAAGNAAQAHEIADRVLRRFPFHGPALMAAGEAAASLGRVDEAIRYYDRIPNDGSLDAIVSQGAAGDLLLAQGHLSAAKSRFRAILSHHPDHLVAHRRLATTLTIEGRRWEAQPHLFQLLQGEQFTVAELVLLGNVEELFDDTILLNRAAKAVPDDPAPALAFARMAFHNGELERAGELLSKVAAADARLVEMQALRGRLWLHQDRVPELETWQRQLPAEADSHPDIWFVRGALAEKKKQTKAALRCYWEALRRHPDHQVANYRLGQLLIASGQSEEGKPFVERSDRLNELAEVLHRILFNDHAVPTLTRAAELCESTGRLWEAWGWYYAAVHFHPSAIAAASHRDRIKRELQAPMPRVVPESNLALRVNFTAYPLLDLAGPESSPTIPATPPLTTTPAGSITFTDIAPETGLDFSFYNGSDPHKPGYWIYQTMGGGVAVLDFNGDLWPDLYFVQACDWPLRSDPPVYSDQLFLNVGGKRFQRVTREAGLGDTGYGEGVSVGDLDQDGFPDLYVANIGRNRLYRNNGDGTFQDISEQAGLTDARWTTSCLLADVNADSLPDLYDVNYLAGNEPFQRICGNEGMRSCKPNLFPAERDRLLLNRGDGTFVDVSDTTGMAAENGKGLGIVAADLTGTGRLDLFVANDTDGNFLLVNQRFGSEAIPEYSDVAAELGCAFDGQGRVQASMGVAVGDANGDQRLDLFVTNFYNEQNTLFQQQPGNYFQDRSQEAGLRDASLPMLGFGTQFLDADLDGWQDLVVANGHIDGFKDIPWKMRPQFFRNQGNGRFQELGAGGLGSYFQRECLGRSLARLDCDRDGRDDFVVSHLDVPAALLRNTTSGAGTSLTVRLVGVGSNRDAIGTTVEVTADRRPRTMQLTAGDGFMASNERKLVFGLAKAERVTILRVRWPDGREQQWHDLPVDAELLIVQGREPVILFANE